MHILTLGRRAYLDFLRNLAPQAVLLSIPLIVGRDLTWACCDVDNTKTTIIFITFMSMFLVAFYANASLFIEDFLTSTKKLNDYSKELASSRIKGLAYLKKLLAFAFKNDKRIFYETVIVFTFLEFSLVFIIWNSIIAATGIMKTLGLH